MAFQLKVLKSTSNQLLNRKELQLEITHTNQSSPDKKSVTEELSSNYSIPAEQIYVYGMRTKPGLHKTIASANMYSAFEDLKKIERSFVVARITGEKLSKIPRRQKKDARIKKYKRFGTLKRNMKRASRRRQD
ncbi:uncharacterized protein VICG_00765 [Vittaforma corneae ATCC 50505]|uniref:Uncharacterized protein n=1 Tax=Vittaforma corneae (strain ATCC 50505) TaxID=993615 RepID=L2GNE8_VITCO|nr:uncharacterized protein VICG_00765 [Vittaforma corneae ATCC 50505]ELA42124.1 hypothetical protein VICG_00765 [Vittaforma corneae ATCC 50505]